MVMIVTIPQVQLLARKRKGKAQKGPLSGHGHNPRKLSAADVAAIRQYGERHGAGKSVQRRLAAQYGVRWQTIEAVLTWRTHARVSPEPSLNRTFGPKRHSTWSVSK